MRDLWVNSGRELPLTIYEEQILDHFNPKTTQLLVAMGFQAENLSVAIKGELFSFPMASYIILEETKRKKQFTIRPQSLPFGVPNCFSLSVEVSTFFLPLKQTHSIQQKGPFLASAPAGLQRKPESFSEAPRHDPVAFLSTQSISSSGSDPEMSLTHQAPQHDPMASPSTQSTSSSGGDPEMSLAQQASPA
ncbi:PREDICTED: serine/threonine-protein kinase MARK2-like [Rhinopithecus bieti]|uniref:serine/threonine-protein kinase MARK2-like n=1 Tax=Rhinopithecus bieti TaxID=61621 RepID=UPI00083BE27A|nr:PREDICTED: serine/threonine-protein kinase MARK2-like [Rhinopithecus bieti]